MKILEDEELLSILDLKLEKMESGLLYGKAGMALYYAELSEKDKRFTPVYNRIMESLMSDISENIPIEFGRGLIGISLAMDFIMKYFKKGNPDYVLDDIDAVLYKSLDISNFKKFMNLGLVSEGLFYISVHLKYGIVNDYKKRLYEKKLFLF